MMDSTALDLPFAPPEDAYAPSLDEAPVYDTAQDAAVPYEDSHEHLREELSRIDLLLRAQTVRWLASIAATKPPHLWGMLNVSHEEIGAYLASPSAPLGTVDDAETGADEFVRAAAILDELIVRRLGATPAGLRLQELRRRFDLSDLESDALLLCLLPDLEARYRRLYGYLQDDASRVSPRVEFLLQVLAPLLDHATDARTLFDADDRLLRASLLQLSGDGPLSTRSVSVDERIVAFLLGSDRFDRRLTPFLREEEPLAWAETDCDDETLRGMETLAGRLLRTDASLPPFVLKGRQGSGRRRLAQAFATEAGLRLLTVDVGLARQDGMAWRETVALCYREAILQDAALLWHGCDPLFEDATATDGWSCLAETTDRAPIVSIFACESHEPLAGASPRQPIRIELQMPSYDRRRRIWQTVLGAEDLAPGLDLSALADELASAFRLNRSQISEAVAMARSQALLRDPLRPNVAATDLHESCRRQSGRRLLSFGRRIEPRDGVSFADLVLPPANQRQVQELRVRIRRRAEVAAAGFEQRMSLGKGLIALFTGSSGTGKTMAAELLAREQGVDLIKVDLSAVVSKWVGETEKNLAGVFREAEDANAILFFDEADALFGKRGEVRESHDRWANMEVNFLLQRVEEYAGTVILASNLRQNIDEAFLRRIHVLVEFPAPDADARLRILQGLFPPGIARPCDDELRLIAERFSLTGGNLKNIVLDAAYRALDEGAPAIDLTHLAVAVGREYQKLGRPIMRSEFGDDFYATVDQHILEGAPAWQ